MCKLYIATGKLTSNQVDAALHAANRAFRNSEKDGFGFLAARGLNIARGRYLDPSTYTGYMCNLPNWLAGPMIEENNIPKNPNVLIVHGRTSTNTKGLNNVHPFCYEQYYLAHNGMVSWTGPRLDEPPQSCDSNQLLHWLVDNQFDWKTVEQYWSGWGAVAVYDRKSGKLTIARDCANLHIARRVNGKGWVFATDAKQLVGISKYAGIALDTPPLMFPKHIVDIIGGRIVSEQAWEGFGYRQWTKLDNLASGTSGKVKPNGRVDYAKDFFPDYDPKINIVKLTGGGE